MARVKESWGAKGDESTAGWGFGPSHVSQSVSEKKGDGEVESKKKLELKLKLKRQGDCGKDLEEILFES